jgi:hypothetical protein
MTMPIARSTFGGFMKIVIAVSLLFPVASCKTVQSKGALSQAAKVKAGITRFARDAWRL